MVYYFTPYSKDGLGHAYNDVCKIVPNDDDWICLLDGDTMFLSNTFGRQIEDVIKTHKQFSVFTCYATRIGGAEQRWKGVISKDRDMVNLKKEVMQAETANWGKVTELKRVISGHLMLFQKKTWNEIKFPTESKRGKLLGIDNVWSARCLKRGKRIARMDGLVLAHFYRLDTGRGDKSHLKLN